MKRVIRQKQFVAGSCYSYVLSSNNEAAIIDPHISLRKEYLGYLKKEALGLKFIIDTHTHADHFSLAAVLKKETGAKVVMHEKAVSEVADRRVSDSDQLYIGEGSLKIIYTPGHTDDAVSVYAEGMLFTGDVLLIGSVGRTDFQNGSPESMFDTLQKIKSLPSGTLIFPGHDYHGKRYSKLGIEKNNNPFLKEKDRGAFVSNMRSKNIPRPFNIDNIIRVNRLGSAVSLEMVSPQEAYGLATKDPVTVLLDVRSPLEFKQVHIKGSVNMPIDMLLDKIDELNQPKLSYIVLCRTGNRSPMAADMLMQSGISPVRVLDGGILRWQKEHFPVVKGEGGISLERQARLIAGVFVLAGIVLSLAISPWFLGISIFVSCGLIFAGLTDNCLMGMLLMKLPYNKKLYKVKTKGGTCAISS